MSKSKMLLNLFLRKFSGIITLILLGIIASIASGDLNSLIRIIMNSWYIILPLIFLIIIVSYRPAIKGFLGEKSVQMALSRLDKSKYTVLNNIMLQVDNKTTQIDHVIVSNYGIFVIETKNYKGWILGDEYSEYWTQVIYKRKEKLYNPIRQNYGHILALKEHLKDFGDIPFRSIVTFSRNADLKVTSTTDVVYMDTLPYTIKKYNIEVLNDAKKEEICNRLISLNIRDKKVKSKHVESIQKEKNRIKSNIRSNLCPRCGNPLVIKSGKYGEFKGCSGYPKCKYTAKV